MGWAGGGGSQSCNDGFLKVDYWQLPIPAVNLPLKTKLMIPAYFPLLDLRKIVSGSPSNCVGQHVCQCVWVYRSGTNVGQSEKIQKGAGSCSCGFRAPNKPEAFTSSNYISEHPDCLIHSFHYEMKAVSLHSFSFTLHKKRTFIGTHPSCP